MEKEHNTYKCKISLLNPNNSLMPGLGGEGADLARLWEGDWAGKSSSIVFSFITSLSLSLPLDWQSCFLVYNVVVSVSIIHCEQERNIAIELEQKMMEDFEWKLREVEGGYKTKIKSLEEGLESKVKSCFHCFQHWSIQIHHNTREITRAKDAELTKMCIDARRDMEEKLKKERDSQKASLEAAAARSVAASCLTN